MARNRDRKCEARRLLGVGLGIIAVLFFFNALYPSALAIAELKTFDLRMCMRKKPRPRGDVAIVAIDDKSVVELGRWPWPRSVLARLTQALKSYHAGVVGFDMVF